MSIFRNVQEKLKTAERLKDNKAKIFDRAHKSFSEAGMKIQLKDNSVLSVSKGEMTREEVADLLCSKLPEDVQLSGPLELISKGAALISELTSAMKECAADDPCLAELSRICLELQNENVDKTELLVKKWQLLLPALSQQTIQDAIGEAADAVSDKDPSREALNALLNSFNTLIKTNSDAAMLALVMEGVNEAFGKISAPTLATPKEEEDAISGRIGKSGKRLKVPEAFAKAYLEKNPGAVPQAVSIRYGALYRWTRKRDIPDEFTYKCAEKGMLTSTEVVAAYQQEKAGTADGHESRPWKPENSRVPQKFAEKQLKETPDITIRTIASNYVAFIVCARRGGVTDDNFIRKCAEEGMTEPAKVIAAYSAIQKQKADELAKTDDETLKTRLMEKLVELNVPPSERDAVMQVTEKKPLKIIMRNLDKLLAQVGPSMTAVALTNSPLCLQDLNAFKTLKSYKRRKKPKGMEPLLKKLEDMGMDEDVRNFVASFYAKKKHCKVDTLVKKTEELNQKLGREKTCLLLARVHTILTNSKKFREDTIKKHLGSALPKETAETLSESEVETLSADLNGLISADELKEELKLKRIPLEELQRRVRYINLFDVLPEIGSFRSRELFYKDIVTKLLKGVVPSETFTAIVAGPERTEEAVRKLAVLWEKFGPKTATKLLEENANRLVAVNVVDSVFEKTVDNLKYDLIRKKLEEPHFIRVSVDVLDRLRKREESTGLILERLDMAESKLRKKVAGFINETDLDHILGKNQVFASKLEEYAKKTVEEAVGSVPSSAVSKDVISKRASDMVKTLTVVEENFGSSVLADILADDGIVLTLAPEEAVKLVEGKVRRADKTYEDVLKELKEAVETLGITSELPIPTTEKELRDVSNRLEEMVSILGKTETTRMVKEKPELLMVGYDAYATEVLVVYDRIRAMENLSQLIKDFELAVSVDEILADGIDAERAYKNLKDVIDFADRRIVDVMLKSKSREKLLTGNVDEVFELLEKYEEEAKKTVVGRPAPVPVMPPRVEADELMKNIIATVPVPLSVGRYLADKGLDDAHNFAYAVFKAYKNINDNPKMNYVEKEVGRYAGNPRSVMSALKNCGVLDSKKESRGGDRTYLVKGTTKTSRELYKYLSAVSYALTQGNHKR